MQVFCNRSFLLDLIPPAREAAEAAVALAALAAAFGGSGFVGGLDLTSNGDGQLQRLALTVDGHGQHIAGVCSPNQLHQVIAGGDLGVIYLRNDVVDLQAGFLSRAVRGDGLDGCAAGQAILLGLVADGQHGDADEGLFDVAVFNDALHNAVDLIDGNGKADVINGGAGRGGRAGILGVGNANHLAIHIEQGAAGVAGVDGTVGLDQVHGGAGGHGDLPIQGTDNTGGFGEGQLTQGVADGHHAVAHVQLVGVANDHGGQAGGIDLQHGYIVALVIADELGVILGAVVGGDGDGGCAFNHVVVGQDIAVIGEDEAGACRRAGGLLAPEIGGDQAGDNAHGRIYIGGIDLCAGEDLAGVDLLHL